MVNKTFDETGCVSKTLEQGHQRKRTVTTAENVLLVAEEIFRSPDIPKSHRRLFDTLNISASPLYRILQELNLKPYMPRLFHGLNDDDPDRRLQFASSGMEWQAEILNSLVGWGYVSFKREL